MKIVQCHDYEAMSQAAAQLIADAVTQQPSLTLGLATGSTPERTYELLVEKYRRQELTFKDVTTFNLDEYVGLGQDSPQSYRYYMVHRLFKYIDIDQNKIHLPNGLAQDIELECRNYEQRIDQVGGIDLQLLGLGNNGHIGFNEPGTARDEKTHKVTLDESTILANARFFDNPASVPTEAISMGIDTILRARQIILAVSGEAKAAILQQVVHGEVTPQVPASFLQEHPNVTIVTDIDMMMNQQ